MVWSHRVKYFLSKLILWVILIKFKFKHKIKKMNNLIVAAHPNKDSFCIKGITQTIVEELTNNSENIRFLDLYREHLSLEFSQEKVNEYKELVLWADRIYFISPVWWFRTTPLLESFFDQVFTPGFAYKFVPVTKTYGYPKPLLKNKKVRTYLTHGAPALPVITLYLNSVKLRLVMGVYSFVFGWFKTKTRQFWSVPFVTQNKRMEYLDRVKLDVRRDLK